MKYIFLLFFPIFIFGCDLFSVRDAEAPNQPRSNYQLAVTPDILIENLQNSLKDKSMENYIASFANSSFTKTYLLSW